jgi:hypothetical protein
MTTVCPLPTFMFCCSFLHGLAVVLGDIIVRTDGFADFPDMLIV